MKKKITALVIMDGFGLSDEKEGNAVAIAGAKNVFKLMKEYPSTTLRSDGLAVGLPKGQMGNSEVGHLNLGAGRIIYQELTRISKAVEDGDFFTNPAFIKAAENVKKNNSALHLIGLVSDGGVHSTIEHIYALLEFAKKQGVKKVFVHCFLDGRDTPPSSGLGYLKELQAKIKEIGAGQIATVCGRFYAMDRDNRWDRVEKAYDLLTAGKGEKAESFEKALEKSYSNGVTDEFVLPVVITKNGKPVGTVQNSDSVIFFNFRPDRAREITSAFTQKGFDAFSLEGRRRSVCWVCFTQYDEKFENVEVAFKPESYENTLGQYLSELGKKQVRIAETEKYAHVTYFFNGGAEKVNDGEDRILVPSKKVATYDTVPEMSAYEVTAKAEQAIKSGEYDFMVLNLANCDMVGHTGVLDAAVKAVSVTDACVKALADCILKSGGRMLLTADHGNAEKMLDGQGGIFTAHTLSEVPFVLVDDSLKGKITLEKGSLCDIAPTILHIMGLSTPKEMTGKSLITEKEKA